jgi:hypothetical protein
MMTTTGFTGGLVEIWPVSTRVNNVRNQEADLLVSRRAGSHRESLHEKPDCHSQYQKSPN